MKTILLVAAASMLVAVLAPTASADIVIRQCGPQLGCSGLGGTIPTDLVSCTVTLPANVGGAHYPLVSCAPL